jgi:carbonic anhydrase
MIVPTLLCFSLFLPGYADVVNADVKVPSEHTLYGKRYDAEWQVFHMSWPRQRTPVSGAMISAENDEYNIYFQEALDAFQHVYNVDRAKCARRIRKRRRLVTRMHRILGKNTKSEFHDYETWADFSTELEQPDFSVLNADMKRKLTKGWSPIDQSLLPSIYFFGYEGSLTEPPFDPKPDFHCKFHVIS